MLYLWVKIFGLRFLGLLSFHKQTFNMIIFRRPKILCKQKKKLARNTIMSSLMMKNLHKSNAIPLLLSRINKAKVYRGWEHEPRESQKSGGLAAPARRRFTHQGTKPAKGAGYGRAQPVLAAGMLCFQFCLWSPATDRTGKSARSWWSLPASSGEAMREKGEAVIQLLDAQTRLCVRAHGAPAIPCWINRLLA